MEKKKFLLAVVLALVFTLALASGALAQEGTTMSGEISKTINVSTGVGTVVDKYASKAVAGMYDIFTVATQLTNSTYENTLVRAKVTLQSGNSDGFTLEYLEQTPGTQNYGKFLPLPFEGNVAWYGPSSGFPLIDNTQRPSVFRVTWNRPGTYEFKTEVIPVQDTQPLAEATVTVTVVDGLPISLQWDPNAAPPDSVAVNTPFDVGVTASPTGLASELDHALYIIEIQKNGQAATKDDFTIVDNPQGIMDTFETVGGVLKGYWGPKQGFLFSKEATSIFQVKFNNPGTYNVKIYAIQVAPAPSVDMTTDGRPAYFSWYYQQ